MHTAKLTNNGHRLSLPLTFLRGKPRLCASCMARVATFNASSKKCHTISIREVLFEIGRFINLFAILNVNPANISLRSLLYIFRWASIMWRVRCEQVSGWKMFRTDMKQVSRVVPYTIFRIWRASVGNYVTANMAYYITDHNNNYRPSIMILFRFVSVWVWRRYPSAKINVKPY